MVREFSEEKRQEIFRLLDEIDMRDWKSFMEWCGSRKEEFGDWSDKLSVSAYTRYVDEYHEKVLETNEMTRQQVNTVFENEAEIDARYAARFREHREKVKEQIAIVKTMTEFMDSMSNGNPNMALLDGGSVNKAVVRTAEGTDLSGTSEDDAESGTSIYSLSDYFDSGKEFSKEEILQILESAKQSGDITQEEYDDLKGLFTEMYDSKGKLLIYELLQSLREVILTENITQGKYDYIKILMLKLFDFDNNDLGNEISKEEKNVQRLYKEIEEEYNRILERILIQKYINEDVLRDGLGWDIEAAKENINDNFIEEMQELMLEYGLTDERSIILFLITITKECDHGKSMIEYGDETYYDDKSYSAEEKGAGLLQLTTYEIQMKFLEYITGREEGADFDDLLEDMSPAEYISTHYPTESALWYWCVYDEKITFNGENYSINDAIETYGDTADFYNMFIATQCAVVGSEFWPRGIGRCFMHWNEIELSDELYIQITEDENGKQVEIPHPDGSIILYYKDTEDDEDYIDPPVQSYKPTGLSDRINIYNDFLKYIESEMS